MLNRNMRVATVAALCALALGCEKASPTRPSGVDTASGSAAELPADLELAERGLPQPLDHLGPGRFRVVVVGVAPDQRGRVGAERELVTASGAEAVGGADGFAALETGQSGGHQVTELSWRSRCEY